MSNVKAVLSGHNKKLLSQIKSNVNLKGNPQSPDCLQDTTHHLEPNPVGSKSFKSNKNNNVKGIENV